MLTRILQEFSLTNYIIPVWAVSTIIFSIGLFILLQNRRSLVNISFSLICLVVCIWFYTIAILYGLKTPELALAVYRTFTFLGVSLISPCVYFFSAVWFKRSVEQKKGILLGFVGAAAFYLIGLLTPYGFTGARHYFWGFYPSYGVAGVVFILFFFGYFFAAFYNFVYNYKNEKSPLKRRQIRLIAFAFLLSFTGSVDYIPKFFNAAVYPIGYISVFSWILVVAYCIVRYKAMDIETVIHKTLMWVVTTLVAIIPFCLVIHITQERFKSVGGWGWSFLITFQAILFYFYFSRLQPFLSQLFRRRHADLQTAFQSFSSDLVHLKNIRSLLQRIVRLIRRTLYVRQVSLYMADENGGQLMPVIVKGMRGARPISKEHPFIRWIAQRDEVAVLDFAQEDPEAAEIKTQMLDYFTEMNAAVAVPLLIGGNLLGMLHLGKKENLRRISSSEMHFLTQLKSPMTIALSNSLQFENVSKLYEQVQLQNSRLKELDRLKSQFLANTSHELRTPLNGILGLVEAMLDGADGDVNTAQARHLRMIIESGANLKDLINNLLELSRIESGQARLDVKPFNVINVVDSVLALMEGVARKKNIQLLREFPAVLPDVYGDPEKIQRVLINLVGNALKFTETGSVKVKVVDAPEGVGIDVMDTGIGIAANDLQIIFERFRQADGGDTRSYEGTGLGLSIAREIIRAHGSDISVHSSVGQGSVFGFRLSKTPLAARAAVESTPSVSAAPSLSQLITEEEPREEPTLADKAYPLTREENSEADMDGHGEIILVVDDNEVNREVIRTRLEMHHYTVAEAADGLQALEQMEQTKPALILLDLMMPRMSGYDFCRRVREKYGAEEVPIIMLTAKTDMGDKVYGLNIGANDYISKPFNHEELIARVGVFLKIRHMHTELSRWNAELEQRVELRTRELQDTQKQLVRAEKMATMGTFAGGIAHEINNPLTAVLTNAQILKMSSPNPEDIELIDMIEEGAKRCQIIIKKLMKYTRKEADDSPRDDVSLAKVVETVTGMLGYQLKNDNVEIEVDLKDLPLIKGLATELEQVFTNLFFNARDAIKSAGRDQGIIRVQGSVKQGFVSVEIIDNGMGIKADNLDKIFDPFFTTKDVGSGTGLGLSVTHSILEKHRCKVHVESEWGVGTRFSLRFPAAN